MLVLPDDILFNIAETQKSDPNVVSDNESSKKEDNKVNPISRKNKVQKVSVLGPYTKDYYRSLFDFLHKSQAKFWNNLNRFILGDEYFDNQVVAEEDYSFLGRLFRRKEKKPEIPKCPEPLTDSFISRIFKVVKKIYDAFDLFLKIKKWYNKAKKIYNTIKNWAGKNKARIKKFVQTIRKILSKTKKRLINLWKKHIKPILKRSWNLIKRLFRRIRVVFKKAWRRSKKIFKKVLKTFFKWLKRRVKKVFKKVLKILIKKLGKQALRLLLKLLGNALIATGVGAIIGGAIVAATWAWEAYDIYDMVRPEPPDPFEDDEEVEEEEIEELNTPNIKGELDRSKPSKKIANLPQASKSIQSTNSVVIQKNEDGTIKMGEGNKRYKDDIINSLYSNADNHYIIFGSLYELYQHCYRWLQGQEEFAIKSFEKFSTEFDKIFNKINDFLYNNLNYNEKDWLDHCITKYGFDPFHNRNRSILKPKEWNPNERMKVADDYVTRRWKDGKGIQIDSFYLRFQLGKEYASKINFIDDSGFSLSKLFKSDPQEKLINKLTSLLKDSNKDIVKQYPKYKDYNPADISSFDKKKLANVQDMMKNLTKLDEAKLDEMNTKNKLLHEYWNRMAWLDSGLGTFARSI